ncbi:NACHT domain-containing protein [Kitasatospora sp. NPDC054768]
MSEQTGRYNYELLGEKLFQQLCNALLAHCFPDMQCFPVGHSDGGRDAVLPRDGAQEAIFQVKWTSRPLKDPVAWLTRTIDRERANIERLVSAGARQYFLLTSMAGTAVPGRGTMDRFDAELAKYSAEFGLGMRIWWRADIDARVDAAPDSLKFAYPGMLTGHDHVRYLIRGSPATGAHTRPSLMRSDAAAGLVADRWLRLGQAGAEPSSGRIGLGPVAVDLKAEHTTPGGEPGTVLACQHVIEHGDNALRPSGQRTEAPQHVLLFGGPGQGKTTLGQLICQAYRVAMFDDNDRLLPAPTRDLLRSLRRDLTEAGIPAPRRHRWPLRITLHDYALSLAHPGPDTAGLLRFMARQVGRGVTEADLRDWLREWPWLLVLDGLDEVPRPARETVMEGVNDFLTTARSVDADLLVVGTTRPQGYHGEFHPGDYTSLTLSGMTADDALHYAGRLARARHRTDPEMYATVVERITAAAADITTRQLLGSPLQVAIMSLLVEKRRQLPQNRFKFFEAYYNTVYTREAEKPGRAGELLTENQHHIDWLHLHAGLTIQSKEAVTEPSDPLVLSEDALRERLRLRLCEETEDPARAEALSSELVAAATERLVLLVSPRPGAVGFEVKSLQEYCAAGALLSGPDADIVPRLADLATDQTWYQAWLLTAAGLFTDHPHLRDEFLVMLRGLDKRGLSEMLVLPGAHLALALLDEDLARQHPRRHTALVQHAAELITAPDTFEYDYTLTFNPRWAMPRTLARAAEHSEQARTSLENAARAALGAQGLPAVHCLRTITNWARAGGCLQPVAQALLESATQHMGAEQRAAVRLFTSDVLVGAALPGLAGFSPTGTGDRTTLAAFLPGTVAGDLSASPRTGAEAAAWQWVADWASELPVTYELVDGVAVPLVDDDSLWNGPYLMDSRWEWEWLPHARRICAEAALAQPATGWSIARALQAALGWIASWDVALEPSVRGIT